MPKGVQKRIVKSMIKIVENKIRVSLPEELTVNHTAKQYLDLMEKVIQERGEKP